MYTETFLKAEEEDFPGGSLVVHLPSKAGGAGLISAWGSKIPRASWLKNPKPKTETVL